MAPLKISACSGGCHEIYDLILADKTWIILFLERMTDNSFLKQESQAVLRSKMQVLRFVVKGQMFRCSRSMPMTLFQASQISFESEVCGVTWRDCYNKVVNK